MSDGPRVLVLDIETSPNLGYIWALYKQDIGLSQLVKTTEVICFAAKFHGEKDIYFASVNDGVGIMRDLLYELLDEADVVVTWNGINFDIPHINRELLEGGYPPPSPFKHVDLCQVVKKNFRFTSNKLDHVAKKLGVGGKLRHTGFDLWLGCMAGDPKAWALMERYNRRDVVITDKVYTKLLPWIPNHPHVGLYSDDPSKNVCGRCGSNKLKRRGFAYTSVGRFQRFRCDGCGSWSRTGKRDAGVEVRPVA